MVEIDDDEIVINLLDKNETGIWQLLEKHGPRVLGALKNTFPGIAEEDRDIALEYAVKKAFRSADTYDESKAPIGVWFTRVALNMAKDLLKTGRIAFKHDTEGEFDPIDEQASVLCEEESEYVESHLESDLVDVIKNLPEAQKKVALADLSDGNGSANTHDLAQRLKVGASAIRVNRMRYRKSLQDALRKKGYSGLERKVPR